MGLVLHDVGWWLLLNRPLWQWAASFVTAFAGAFASLGSVSGIVTS